jgi:hypothetical protein
VFNEVVGLRHGIAGEGGARQVVQAFETAALQQLRQAALQCHFEAGVRAERSEHTAGLRVHQRHAHQGVLAAQRGIFHQNRKALRLQRLDAGQDARVLGQHVLRHIGQRDFPLQDLALDRTLEDL